MSREKVFRFGRETKRVGSLSEPPSGMAPAGEPMVLLVKQALPLRRSSAGSGASPGAAPTDG